MKWLKFEWIAFGVGASSLGAALVGELVHGLLAEIAVAYLSAITWFVGLIAYRSVSGGEK